MCEAREAATARHEAATNLRRTVQSLVFGQAIAAAIPIEPKLPREIESLLAQMDARGPL